MNTISEGEIPMIEPCLDTLKSGSCAIAHREPCQVGDQAALSGIRSVPRGCLLRVKSLVFAEELVRFFGVWSYFLIFQEVAYASGVIQKMASKGF